jgi:hypothetical protein
MLCNALVILSLCGCWDIVKPTLTMKSVTLPSGAKIFVKREQVGLSTDHLALSLDSNPCTRPDPKKDYMFPGTDGVPVYYSVSGNTITIYHNEPLREPEQPFPDVRVVTKVMTRSKEGIVRLDVGSNDDCR